MTDDAETLTGYMAAHKRHEEGITETGLRLFHEKDTRIAELEGDVERLEASGDVQFRRIVAALVGSAIRSYRHGVYYSVGKDLERLAALSESTKGNE